MVNWIMPCVRSAKYSININGSLEGYFLGGKGIRQGDLMSLYLFILAMEYLNRLLTLTSKKQGFKFHPKCHQVG